MVTMWITGYDTQRSCITLWELAERANSTSLFTINTNIKTALVKMWYADHLIEISIENANSTSKDEHVDFKTGGNIHNLSPMCMNKQCRQK